MRKSSKKSSAEVWNPKKGFKNPWKFKMIKCPLCNHKATLSSLHICEDRLLDTLYAVECSNLECDNHHASVWVFDFDEAVERWNSHGVEFPPDKLIEDIPVSERVRNTLAREGIHTLKQALCYEGNLQHLRNFGTKSYNELLAVLRDYLSLSQTSDESNANNKKG